MYRKYLALTAILLALGEASRAATIYVDAGFVDDPNHRTARGSQDKPFNDVQEAIDAAKGGDTIIVMPGRYVSTNPWDYGELKFNNKNIRVQSSAPTDFEVVEKTILCGVVVFRGSETADCRLEGFKIQNHTCGGILGNRTQATISHCIITGNGPCGATVMKDCRGLIQNCLIADNTTFHGCGVQAVISNCLSLVNCTVVNNLSGIDARLGGRLHNCIIYGNAGPQLLGSPHIEHCLIENGVSATVNTGVSASRLDDDPCFVQTGHLYTSVLDADPCFVRPGYWTGDVSDTIPTLGGESVPIYSVGSVLVEGDYHLMSAGWRWSREEVDGSRWGFDASTSPAIDAGDPIDMLTEEPERVPADPQGQRGFNHAIDLGVYGGTSQASLAPTKGKAPGFNAVDLHDYWPFDEDNAWYGYGPDGNLPRSLVVAERMDVNGLDVHVIEAAYSPNQYATYWTYADYELSMAKGQDMLTRPDSFSPPTAEFQGRYPQYLTLGSVVQVPDDPFVHGTPTMEPAVVVRGTLEEVIAGTGLTLVDFTGDSWADVIALRGMADDGTAGPVFTIFARGFGPLMLAGQRIVGGDIRSTSYGSRVMPRFKPVITPW
jgi:hypothetical protein